MSQIGMFDSGAYCMDLPAMDGCGAGEFGGEQGGQDLQSAASGLAS
jgi:hypothetical protein